MQTRHHPGIGVLILFSLLWSALPGVGAPPADAEAKIDGKLIAALMKSQDGTTPFFAVFGERAQLGQAFQVADRKARGRLVMDLLIATADRSQNGARGFLKGRGVKHTAFWVENKIYVEKGTLDIARMLAKRPEVAAIIPEAIYTPPLPLISPAAVQPVGWNLPMIGVPQVWDTYNNFGAGIVVANIDSGVQYNHPALVRQYRGNLGAGSFNHNGNWYDPANACGGVPCDTGNGHGTHVMGTMVGDNGGGIVIGAAPAAKWISCKACSAQQCPDSALIACAQWILAPGGDPSLRPDVVNNSWVGGPSGDVWYRSYVQNWRAAGIFPAFAAGNAGPGCGTVASPGDYPEAFATGATGMTDLIFDLSSRGPSFFGETKPDVTAPGVSIYSSVPTDQYMFMSGTSMASPHTAGLVALLWAIRPSYRGNVAATEWLLQSNAAPKMTAETCGGLPLGAVPNNTYGSGRLDAKRSVDAATAVQQPPTVSISSPSAEGQQFYCGTRVVFAGTASDVRDGNLSSRIIWTGAGVPAGDIGSRTIKTFQCDRLGNQVVRAKVQNSSGLTATDFVVVNIVNPGIPSAPSDLAATLSGTTVHLVWRDNATGENGFKVYRRQMSGGVWGTWLMRKRIDAPDSTSFSEPAAAGTYAYYVQAFNAMGESTPSNTVIVTR